MRLLVTGSRDWQNYDAIEAVLRALNPRSVIHGDHWEGADRMVDWAAVQLKIPQEKFPADWYALGKKAGALRNQLMVDSRPDMVVAFRAKGSSPGTDDCIARAKKAGIPVLRYDE